MGLLPLVDGRGLVVLQSEGMGTIAGPPARGVSGVAAAMVERVVRRMVVRDILVDLSDVVPLVVVVLTMGWKLVVCFVSDI